MAKRKRKKYQKVCLLNVRKNLNYNKTQNYSYSEKKKTMNQLVLYSYPERWTQTHLLMLLCIFYSNITLNTF